MPFEGRKLTKLPEKIREFVLETVHHGARNLQKVRLVNLFHTAVHPVSIASDEERSVVNVALLAVCL